MLQLAIYFKRLAFACGLGLALLSGILLVLHPVRATQVRPLSALSTFAVDRTDDVNSAAAWVCGAAANDCSLRGALINANANPGAIVQLPDGVVTITLTITPTGSDDATSGDLNVTADMTIAHMLAAACLGPKSCHTTIRGGAAWADRILTVARGVRVQMGEVTLRGGHETTSGGGVYNAGDLTLINSTVRNNEVNDDFSKGGGIYNDGNLALINTTVMNNQITGTFNDGGGIYNHHDRVLTLTHSAVMNNQALADFSSGGGIFNDGVLLLANSEIQGNTVSDNGGGLYNYTGEVMLADSAVLSNTADSGGGVLNRGAMTLTNSLVQGNMANQYGGLDNFVGELIITASIVQTNTASSYGGGLGNAGGTLIVDNSTVQGNTAGGHGGGLYHPSGQATLNDSVVRNNVTTNNGGGIYSGAVITVRNSTVQSNTASGDGGGLYASERSLLTDTQVMGNVALGSGGGVFAAGSTQVSGGRFANNRSTGGSGGGLHAEHEVTLSVTMFSENLAVQGGGLYLGSTGVGTFVNSLFARNAAAAGMALYLDSIYTTTVTHNTIVGLGPLGSAAIQVNTGTVGITDTIITRHTIGISNTGGLVSEDYNLFFNDGINTSGVVSGAHSVIGDPQFVNPVDSNFHIGAASAALNVGIDAGVPLDFEDDARPQGGGFDIGFDEYPSRLFLPLVLQ